MLSMIVLLAACNGDQDFQALKPDIVVTPEVLDFGEVVADYSAPGTIQIFNAGLGILEIDEITINGDDGSVFTIDEVPLEVPGDSEYALALTFLPPDPLPYTATLTIHSNDEEHDTVPVTLIGTGIEAPTPDIACDSLSLDFGTLAPGGSAALWFTCTNLGDDDLYISEMVQRNSGSFFLASDPTGNVLPPGQPLQLIVVYTPTTSDGDNGTITLTTNDPDEPETVLTMVGNGGGSFEYPVAVVDCPTSAVPRETVTVGGGASYDPNGLEPLTYRWTVTGPYDDVVATQSGTDVYVQLDLAGEYRVSLQVENSIGLLSAPSVCRVDAVPEEEFHVELIWKDTNDMDLHLLNSSGTLFDGVNDCNYCNVNPEWGEIGAADNPTLDLDALASPPGVENINIDSPADDTYSVKVHYYESSGAGDVTATVNIYLYGVLEGSYSRVMSRNKVWDVAQIVWPDGYVVEDDTALYNATLRACE
ncbi:MAG: choice-of-anchor D domain-containing protein [Pseudomonadota bacterium]|nr:choice-of-anchor D domain-containing protein [Pseudomonadota bacterium]